MSWQRFASAFAVIVVVAAIVAGLVISGSPARQRLLRLDEQRVSDLQDLSQSLSFRYSSTRELPAELAEIVDGRIMSSLPRDPVSGQAYAYELLERRVFQLCAEFALASEDPQPDQFWSHAAGRQCFRFDLSSMRFAEIASSPGVLEDQDRARSLSRSAQARPASSTMLS